MQDATKNAEAMYKCLIGQTFFEDKVKRKRLVALSAATFNTFEGS